MLQRVTLSDIEVTRQIAAEEHHLIEGFTLQPSRSSTLQCGISLTRSVEVNGKLGLDIGMVKAEIGGKVADMLTEEIREVSMMHRWIDRRQCLGDGAYCLVRESPTGQSSFRRKWRHTRNSV